MPQGSAWVLPENIPDSKMGSVPRIVQNHFLLGVFICFLHLNTNFNLPLTIFFAVTDPNLIQFLPFTSGLVNREPRSCYEVHAL